MRWRIWAAHFQIVCNPISDYLLYVSQRGCRYNSGAITALQKILKNGFDMLGIVNGLRQKYN